MSERRPIAELVRQTLGAFSPAERKVGLALLAGSGTDGLESSSRLARAVGVSGPTVIRFVNRLGFTTYGQFQEALREDLAEQVSSPVAVYRRGGTVGAVDAFSDAVGAALHRSLTELPAAELDRAVDLLTRGRRVFAFGGWYSQMLAQYLVSLLQATRPSVTCVGPAPNERATLVVDTARSDVVCVFDFRRYEDASLRIAREVKARNGSVILLTDQWLCPIAECADVVLPTTIVAPGTFESLTPAMAVVEVLAGAVIEARGTRVERRLEQYAHASQHVVATWSRADTPR